MALSLCNCTTHYDWLIFCIYSLPRYYPSAVLAKAIDINSLAVALTADVVPPPQRGAAIGFVRADCLTAPTS